MAGRGLLPDLVSYNAAMSACETTNQWQQAAHGKEFDKMLKIRTPAARIHHGFEAYVGLYSL